ncbi:MAG: hypothetical protein ACK421_02855 [Pseudanabaenaceae cyanobacterium]
MSKEDKINNIISYAVILLKIVEKQKTKAWEVSTNTRSTTSAKEALPNALTKPA